jgi:hypothetical protein
MNSDEKFDNIQRTLGRMEGMLEGIKDVPERLSRVERTISWLKGGWTFLAAAWAYIVSLGNGK